MLRLIALLFQGSLVFTLAILLWPAFNDPIKGGALDLRDWLLLGWIVGGALVTVVALLKTGPNSETDGVQ